MKILEERREVKQIPVYDKDGRIEYYKIPNYSIREEILTNNERKFLRTLIKVVQKLNEEYKKKNLYVQISTQVAINRIIAINNKRNSALYEEIKDKSIDYVLYDINTGKILVCIELDGKEHEENEERQKRDILVDKMFNGIVNLVHIKNQDEYDENIILNLLKSKNSLFIN